MAAESNLTRLLSLKAPRDPGFAALRRATRAAIVIPIAFAFGALVLHDTQNVIFIVFGWFALLVMSDFGGSRPSRALAYLTAALVGGVLVTLGTLASPNAGVATAVMFLVGFAISFSRVFGGYVTAAQTGLLLSFVIAVSIPAPECDPDAGRRLDARRPGCDPGRSIPLASIRAGYGGKAGGQSLASDRRPGREPGTRR